MNSLFNYELDERQIRLTLHDADLGYSEAAWVEFDAAYPGHAQAGAKLPQLNLPKIQLNINRNVLVPLFFIIALGGISAIMFRFIDLKANKPAGVEEALIPNASNFKSVEKKQETPEPKTQTAAIKTEAKKDTVFAVANTPPPVATVAVQSPVQSTMGQNTLKMPAPRPANTSSVAVQKPQMSDSSANVSVPAEKTAGDTTAALDQTAANPAPSVNTDKSNYYYYKGKKRRKKVTADQVESLKAPTTLIGTQTAEAEAEPELRLK